MKTFGTPEQELRGGFGRLYAMLQALNDMIERRLEEIRKIRMKRKAAASE